jgi:hypothetical protein
MPSSPPTISSRPPTQPLATKSSKGHHLELDISGLARRFTSSSQKSSTKSLPPGNVPSAPSASADSPSTALNNCRRALDTHQHGEQRHIPASIPAQSTVPISPAGHAGIRGIICVVTIILELDRWQVARGVVGQVDYPGCQGDRNRSKTLPLYRSPFRPISSSFPGLRHAVSFNQSAASGQSGSPPEDKSKGKEKEKVEKEKVYITSQEVL